MKIWYEVAKADVFGYNVYLCVSDEATFNTREFAGFAFTKQGANAQGGRRVVGFKKYLEKRDG